MQPKLVAILNTNSKSEVWVTLEYRNGPTLVFKEQEKERAANEFRKPKPAIAVKAGGIPDLIAALTTTAADLRARGMLPPLKTGDAR